MRVILIAAPLTCSLILIGCASKGAHSPDPFESFNRKVFKFTTAFDKVFLKHHATVYSLLALRYIDLRAQLLETDRIMDEALDKYSFMRDAYLQYRNALINDNQPEIGLLYVDEKQDASLPGKDYVEN